jgi:hypothetical protein
MLAETRFLNCTGVVDERCIANTKQELGYSSAEAQLRVIPVYIAATIVSLTCAWLTDRYRCQYLVIMMTLLPGITGFGILLAGPLVAAAVRYFSCFLIASTAFTVLPTVLAWVNYQVSISNALPL